MGDTDVVLPWIKALPLAPEYHPTEAEFADPIAYILKIEKEASQYGICKIIPPIPKSPKKLVIANLNRCLAEFQNTTTGAPANAHGSFSCRTTENNDNNSGAPSHQMKEANAAKFTTRQQQIGWNPRRPRGGAGGGPMQSVVQKSVWQSGESYTLEEFEAKAKLFSRSRLKTCKDVSPLIVETLFWKAAADKPISVEYANDIPGTAFGEPNQLSSSRQKKRKPYQYKIKQEGGSEALALNNSEGGNGWRLSNTAWNMRIASRSHGSLLRYMPDEVPGVTSPMVYIAMLFSWFAWHVEDHDLHSLNYLHVGAPKTWYGVPGDAAAAFEEVVRCHGYGGQVNPLVAFAMLGEKTTVMSPEILVDAGVPCCRLVQNAGEFVVTFPRAYHLGFSHGFNCGEAANLATPEWLKVAKEAAVRRAAMNYLPMLSHQQLLYLLALSFYPRVPTSLATEPRSSRLKDRKRGEGEMVVKKLFVNDVIKNNHLLSILLQKGSARSAVLWNSANVSCCFPSSLSLSMVHNTKYSAALRVNSLEESTSPSGTAAKSSLVACGNDDLYAESFSKSKEKSMPGSTGIGCFSVKNFTREKQLSCIHAKFPDLKREDDATEDQSFDSNVLLGDMHQDSGLLACVSCGVLGFASMAVIQPCEEAAGNLLPAHFKISNKHFGTSGEVTFRYNAAFGGAPPSINMKLTSEAPIRDDKNGLDNEKEQQNELEDSLAFSGKIEMDGSLIDKQGSQQNLADFSSLSTLQSASTMDLCNNDLPNDCIPLELSMTKDCNAVTCSKKPVVSCEENPCQEHSRSSPSPSIFLNSSPGANINKTLHASPPVSQSDGSTDMKEVSNNKSPGRHHKEFSGLKNWKEASDNLLTCNDAATPNGLSVNTTLGMPGASALDLLAVTYGDLLDSDEENNVIEATECNPLYGLSDVALSCENADELCVNGEAAMVGICDSQHDMLQGNPYVSSSNAVGKVSEEVIHDVHLSGYITKDEPSLANAGLNDSFSNFVGDDTNIMGEGSLCASDQPPKRRVTCHTSVAEHRTNFHEEPDVNGLQDSFVEKGFPVDQHILVPTVSEISSDFYTNTENTLEETFCGKALPSKQLEHRNVELGEIGIKVGEDGKYAPSSNISSIRKTEGMALSTSRSTTLAILEATMMPKSFTGPLATGVDESGHEIHQNYWCDHHAVTQVPTPNESKEMKATDSGSTSMLIRNKHLLHKTALSEAQACNEARGNKSNFVETCSFQGNICSTPSGSQNAASFWKPGKGFLRPRVFCLEHAVEVEEQLQSMGGAHLLLLCHLKYPKIEEQARLLATDVGSDYSWKDIPFKNAAEDALEIIRSAVDDEEDGESGGSDWTVQLGMSLHYTVKLSKSPLYSKQMPYNPVLDALFFGGPLDNYSGLSAQGTVRNCELKIQGKATKQKKITVAGKWCGRVWMVNQVHPYLRNCDQSPDSSDNLRAITVGHGVSRQRGRPRKYAVEDFNCKLLSEPGIAVPSYEPVLTPFLRGDDAQPPGSSGKVTAMTTGGEISRQRGRPRKYTTQYVDSKAMSEPSITTTPGEQTLTSFTKNTQNTSITRSSGVKEKLHSKETRTKVRLLESNTLDTDVKAIVPILDFSPVKPEDHQRVSVETTDDVNLSIRSKRKLDIKPTASSVAGKKQKQRPVRHGDDVRIKDKYAKEKMSQAEMQIQHTSGTYGENNGHVCRKCKGMGKMNFPLLHSCDLFQTQKAECSANKDHGKSEHLSSELVESSDGIAVAMSRTDPLHASSQIKPGGKVRSKRKKHLDLNNGIEALPNPVDNVPDKQNALCPHEHTIQDAGVQTFRNLGVSKAQIISCSSSTTGVPEGGPSTRLRSRSSKSTAMVVSKDAEKAFPRPVSSRKVSKGKKKMAKSIPFKVIEDENAQHVEDNAYHCEIEGCTMAFLSKHDLLLHKRNMCTFKGCGKHFFSHKYLLQHRRVHFDDRPLNCPWKGCKMTFKWAWARTEHIRVHTGERPYICTVPGCGQTFRFVSDFSRHKRKTGHLKQ